MDWETQCHVCFWGTRLVSYLSGVTKSQLAETLGKKDACVGGKIPHFPSVLHQKIFLKLSHGFYMLDTELKAEVKAIF